VDPTAGTHTEINEWGPEVTTGELEMLTDAILSLITERRRSAPWGADGGEPGAVGENWLLPGGREEDAHRLPDKITIALEAGDVIRILTPGGGGWGRPPASDAVRPGPSRSDEGESS